MKISLKYMLLLTITLPSYVLAMEVQESKQPSRGKQEVTETFQLDSKNLDVSSVLEYEKTPELLLWSTAEVYFLAPQDKKETYLNIIRQLLSTDLIDLNKQKKVSWKGTFLVTSLLHWAVLREDRELTELLINVGANPDLMDAQEKTVWDYSGATDQRSLTVAGVITFAAFLYGVVKAYKKGKKTGEEARSCTRKCRSCFE